MITISGQDIIIIISVAMRFLGAALLAAYIIPGMIRELLHKDKSYMGIKRQFLIIGVTLFVANFSSGIYQACRSSYIPQCNAAAFINEIAIINSMGLLAAVWALHLIYRPVKPRT